MKKIWEDIKKHPFGWAVAGVGLLAISVALIVAIANKEVLASIIVFAALLGYGYFIYWQATKNK